MSLSVSIEKRLGNFILKTDLEAGEEVIALFGASGCGKTLTLKCIAGIERPDRGHIEVNGRTLFDSERGIDLPTQQRSTGLMFQNYALFPNMTVQENIACGARRERGQAACKVRDIMERFGLADLAGHYPSELSGGQQQRTALARILVSPPDILLLDEPFSALDSHLRYTVERDVAGILREYGRTVLIVSHDRDEVYRLSDRIAVMDRGRIQTVGTPGQVFSDPGTRAAALLCGCRNISPARRLSETRLLAEDWGLELECGRHAEAAFVGIRMEDIRPGDGENAADMYVIDAVEGPENIHISLENKNVPADGHLLWAVGKEDRIAAAGDIVRVHIPPESLLLLRE